LKKDAVVLPGFDDKQPIEAEQVFTWFTSPIKRLDRLEVGTTFAQSHRTAIRPLMPAKQFPIAAPEGGTATPPGEAGSSLGPKGGGPGPMGPGPGGFGGPGGQGNAPQVLVNNRRYVDLSDQVRRLPIGMVLILDQTYVPDVLTALTNSRLRMWTTQVQWKHIPGYSVPPPPEENVVATRPSGGGGPGPEGPMGPGPMGPGSLGPKPGGGGLGIPPMGPMGPMGPGGMLGSGGGSGYDPNAITIQDDPNLVELSVYAIASLYERYPPKPAAGDQPAAPMK